MPNCRTPFLGGGVVLDVFGKQQLSSVRSPNIKSALSRGICHFNVLSSSCSLVSSRKEQAFDSQQLGGRQSSF